MTKKIRKHGEGTLFPRKDGRWQASFVPKSTGKRKYVYGKTKGEALDKLRLAQEEDRKGVLSTSPRQKLGEYLIYWLETTSRPPMKRVGTYASYHTVIAVHLIPELGHIYLNKLTPQDVQAFYAKKLRQGLKPGYVNLMHRVLRCALGDAVKWGLVGKNVASLTSAPHVERYESPTLTVEQAQKLIEFARGNRMETILTLAVLTGLRRGEICALHWTDVDFDSKVLYVRRTMSRYAKFGLVVNDPKSKSSRRKILLPDLAIQALQEHRERQKQERLRAGDIWIDQGFVFTNRRGGRIEPHYVLRHFKKMLHDLGLSDMRFHDLRHSAATILLALGVDLKVIQKLLGHSTISITADIYAHLLPSMQEEAMEKLDKRFRKNEKKDDDMDEQEKD